MLYDVFMIAGSTLFLKALVALIGLAVLALCGFLMYGLITQDLGGYLPIVAGMLIAAIPFFVGVYQVWKLLSYIDSNKIFSEASVGSLKTIKYCALIIAGMYAVGIPYIYIVANQDDAPGVMLLGLIFTFAPLMIVLFAGLFQKLLQNAIDIKTENELTV